MKKISTRLFVLALTTCMASGAAAQHISESFNSQPDATLEEIKPNLQEQCWQFYNFDVNGNSWDPGIEGDGAMVSGPNASNTQNTGIYTPVLEIAGSVTVSFKYKFDKAVIHRGWFKIYITDGNNNIISRLDSVEVTGSAANTVFTYNQTLWAGSGIYKIYINYQGIDGDERIAIDELKIGARKYYNYGCNNAPVAVNDNKSGGMNRIASGTVITNDYDPENGTLTASLVTPSPDGTVVLDPNGNFTFTPNPGFKGNSTSFTYLICDNGYPSKCSDPATVVITFPNDASLPVRLVDFVALYKKNEVVINWTTSAEVNNDYFDVERSVDGSNFIAVGRVQGIGNSSTNQLYSFTDDVRSINTTKKDLYYRLKQVDRDGKSELSKVVIVRVYNSQALQYVSVTPNPVINNIRVSMQVNETAMVVMKVLNQTGAEVSRKSVRANAGANSFEIEGTSRLTPGIYFLEVLINGKERMVVQLVKN